jgi:hypothetical protein
VRLDEDEVPSRTRCRGRSRTKGCRHARSRRSSASGARS